MSNARFERAARAVHFVMDEFPVRDDMNFVVCVCGWHNAGAGDAPEIAFAEHVASNVILYRAAAKGNA